MTLRRFYEDERRRRSDEATFGLQWRSASDPYTTYGLHWIRATKEIYVLRGPWFPPAFDGLNPPVFLVDSTWEIIVLGMAETEHEVAAALAGWQAEMPKPDSLRWARERLLARFGEGRG